MQEFIYHRPMYEGYRVLDRSISIEVTAEDIAQAVPHEIEKHPIYLAMLRLDPSKNWSILFPLHVGLYVNGMTALYTFDWPSHTWLVAAYHSGPDRKPCTLRAVCRSIGIDDYRKPKDVVALELPYGYLN